MIICLSLYILRQSQLLNVSQRPNAYTTMSDILKIRLQWLPYVIEPCHIKRDLSDFWSSCATARNGPYGLPSRFLDFFAKKVERFIRNNPVVVVCL